MTHRGGQRRGVVDQIFVQWARGNTDKAKASALARPPLSWAPWSASARTLAWKCGGLDAAGLKATLAPSSITLGGLLKHLALVEDDLFSRKLLGREPGPPWDTVDWDADPDWEWHSAAEDTPERLLTLWRNAVGRCRSLVAEALADGGLEQLGRHTNSRGESPSLRRLLSDLIEEYARHVGHADLIRASVDGLTGEDPPG